jgi:hypothetical protein
MRIYLFFGLTLTLAYLILSWSKLSAGVITEDIGKIMYYIINAIKLV